MSAASKHLTPVTLEVSLNMHIIVWKLFTFHLSSLVVREKFVVMALLNRGFGRKKPRYHWFRLRFGISSQTNYVGEVCQCRTGAVIKYCVILLRIYFNMKTCVAPDYLLIPAHAQDRLIGHLRDMSENLTTFILCILIVFVVVTKNFGPPVQSFLILSQELYRNHILFDFKICWNPRGAKPF